MIKLIFEGFAGTAYLTVFMRRELPRTRHRGFDRITLFSRILLSVLPRPFSLRFTAVGLIAVEVAPLLLAGLVVAIQA